MESRQNVISAKDLGRTAGATLLVLFVLSSFVLGIVAAISPRTMAHFANRIGNPEMAATFARRVYRRNPTAGNLYMALDAIIASRNNELIVEYSRKLFAHPNGESAIRAVGEFKASQLPQNMNNQMVSLIANEHDRLRREYVRAHINLGNFDYAVIAFGEDVNFFFDNRPFPFTYPLFLEQIPQTLRVLSRPTRTLFTIRQMYEENMFFRAFMDAHHTKWEPGHAHHGWFHQEIEFFTVYFPQFRDLLHAAMRTPEVDNNDLRVAIGFVEYVWAT